jgi:hypothetical protein
MTAADLVANSRQESQRIALEGRSKEGLFEIRKMNEIECHFYNILGTQAQSLPVTVFEISANRSQRAFQSFISDIKNGASDNPQLIECKPLHTRTVRKLRPSREIYRLSEK